MSPADMNTDLDQDINAAPPEDQTDGEGQEQGGDDEAAIEARARAQGWRPESEWDAERAEREGRRKPKVFLSAREYLEEGERNLPYLRSRLNKVSEELIDTRKKVSDMHQILLDQKRMSQEANQRAFERGLAQAKADMRRAVEEQDMEAFDKAQAKVEQMTQQVAQQQERQRQEQEQQQQAEKPVDPDVERWVQQNQWFLKDPALHAVMLKEHRALRARKPDQDLWDSLEDAAAMVKQRFPESFGIAPEPQQRRSSGSVTAPSGQRGGGSGGGSVEARFSKVPKADQEAYHRQAKMIEASGGKYTKEQFLKEYEQ